MAMIDSLKQVKRVLTTKEPAYLFDRLVRTDDPPYSTRLSVSSKLYPAVTPRTKLSASDWRHRVLSK